jgi:hypothetical protein
VALYEHSVFAGGHLDYRLFRPLWNSRTRKFYISVPATSTNTNGAVDEIDPKSMMVTRVFAIYTPCGPAGLALLPKQRLMKSCSVVLGVKTGGTLATIQNMRVATRFGSTPATTESISAASRWQWWMRIITR